LLDGSSDLPGSLAERAAPPPLFGLAPRGACPAIRIDPDAAQTIPAYTNAADGYIGLGRPADAELLYEARYGAAAGTKMSRETYQALRRKVGGTAKDYWKDWVDVKGTYAEKGYVAKDGSAVSNTSAKSLPILLATFVALLGATGVWWLWGMHLVAGAIWAIFHILIVVLQAFIFMMLTLVYLGQAHEGH